MKKIDEKEMVVLGGYENLDKRLKSIEGELAPRITSSGWHLFSPSVRRIDGVERRLLSIEKTQGGVLICPSCKGLFAELVIVGKKEDDLEYEQEVSLCRHCAVDEEIVAFFAPIPIDVAPLDK